jgi:hypothetical protein
VTSGCCNPAIDGPRFDGKQCCYLYCRGACCGRPFLVDGRARVAALRATDAWRARDREPSHGMIDLDAVTKEALTRAWLADAQMEHASVAAFGRFLLQLLRLGAPADLVRDASLAALDETRHAQLCFGVAAHVGGVAYGPMPLPMDGAFDAWTLEEVIADVVAEGCIGETLAALIAARQLEGASDPLVRRTLARICADEARHSELAWRFLRWALDVGGADARNGAAAAFGLALGRLASESAFTGARTGAAESVVDADAWRAFGRLSANEEAVVVRGAVDTVIVPCANRTFGSGCRVVGAQRCDDRSLHVAEPLLVGSSAP